MSRLFVSQLPFLFQVWQDLESKPRLWRSSWRAFVSTHPLMLPSTSPKKALLACPSSPWNLPSFSLKFSLSSSCSRPDLPLSRHDATLTHLDSLPPHDLPLWTDAVERRPPFSFQQAQYAKVFLLKYHVSKEFSLYLNLNFTS